MKAPRSIEALFMITESSWLYPVWDMMATCCIAPDGTLLSCSTSMIRVSTNGRVGYDITYAVLSMRKE